MLQNNIERDPNILQEARCRCLLGDEARDEGIGTLQIGTEKLVWCLPDGRGFAIRYPQIGVHAVTSAADNAAASKCLYVMADGVSPPPVDRMGDDDEESNDSVEIRFVPDDESNLDGLYKAVCECQLLHPDQEDCSDESGEDDGQFDDAVEDGVEYLEDGSGEVPMHNGWITAENMADFDEETFLTRNAREILNRVVVTAAANGQVNGVEADGGEGAFDDADEDSADQ